MARGSSWQREALSEWRAEQALYLEGELRAGEREQLRLMMQTSLEEDIARQLGVHRYCRDIARRDWRNGYRRRDLVTEKGLLEGLRVPRSRHGTYQPLVFQRYQRRQPLVDELIREMFVAGVSTRRVGEILEALLGDRPSATTVSRIAKTLSEQAKRFHHRPLHDRWRFLLLDGVTMSVKGARGLRKRLVLVVYGIDTEGRRELLDFLLADGESEAQWAALLHHLWGRGLKGAKLELVVTDGAPGLIAALKFIYPHALHQRCWVHKLRNLSNQLRRIDQQTVIAGARAIYQAPTRQAALSAFLAWRRQWQGRYPKAVLCLEKDLNELLACMDFPQPLRVKLRTTNAIERCFVEVRRRTRPMSAFANDASCERIVYALIAHMNAQWSHKPLPGFTHFT
ncbi:MAG: IS256 family transposase [Armatimonadota bacterium]